MAAPTVRVGYWLPEKKLAKLNFSAFKTFCLKYRPYSLPLFSILKTFPLPLRTHGIELVPVSKFWLLVAWSNLG